MKPTRLFCSDCSLDFDDFPCYKQHAGGNEHQQRVAELFQTDPHNGQVHLPPFALGCLSAARNYPVIGLQLVSLCICTEASSASFYLCHACHEKCRTASTIVTHLRSTEHYFSVFACLNPERLHFGWFHPPAMVPGLKAKAEEEEQQQGTGVVRVIDMPKKVFESIEATPYFQTMKELTRLDKLKEILRAHQPEINTVQEYLGNPARTHPLLGLNFLVEYRCTDGSALGGYLCLLCKKRVREKQTIAHVISFDHIYWYLDHMHPSTVHTKSSYSFGGSCGALMLDLAQQAQEISTSGQVQKIELDAEDFAEVDTGSYANALNLLEQIHKERTLSGLLPKVTPLQRLIYSKGATRHQPAAPEPVRDSQKSTGPDGAAGQSTTANHGRLSCLVCAPGAIFSHMMSYKRHVRGSKHGQRMECLFRTDLNRVSVFIPPIVVYEYILSPRRKAPLIGLHLVTACVDTQTAKQTSYLCHICQDKCTSKVINAHLTSSEHYFGALAFLDPEKLHFGWIQSQHMLPLLEPQVRAVEKEQGMGLLQVLDMPEPWFNRVLVTPYTSVVKQLCQDAEMNERLRIRNWTKLRDYRDDPKRKYPLLGLNFLVEYRWTDSKKLRGYLCLLCKKTVRDPLVIAHLIGFEHVFSYLELAHPSSLSRKSVCYGKLILDLATQAEKIDSSGTIQEIKLDQEVFEEVDSSNFLSALRKMQAVSEVTIQTYVPLLVTRGQKLVPQTQKPALSLESKCVDPPSDPENLAQSLEKQPQAQSLEEQPLVPSSEKQPQAQSSATQPLVQPSEKKPQAQSSATRPLVRPSEKQSQAQSSVTRPLVRPSEKPPQAQSSVTQPLAWSSATGPLVQQPLARSSEPEEPGNSLQKLWDYLKNKERQEPVIGLDAVIECISGDLPPYYLCKACTVKITQDFIIHHLTSAYHRYQYLKSQQLLSSVEMDGMNAGVITEKAVALEKERGYGEAHIVEVDAMQFKEIFISSTEVALERLQTVQKQQSDLRPVAAESESDTQKIVNTQEPMGEAAKKVKCTEKQLFIGQPDETKVSKLLDGYLNSKLRKVPVIGLSSLIETHVNNKVELMCKTCAKQVPPHAVIGHLIGPTHRYKYIKSEHPTLLKGWKDDPCMTTKIPELLYLAKVVEKKEGWGKFKVIQLDGQSGQEMGLTSNWKVAPEPNEVTSAVRDPKSVQMQWAESVQKSASMLPPQEPLDFQKMSQLMKFFYDKKKWKDLALIGVREMMECTTVGRAPFYLCKLCKTTIRKKQVITHVTALGHRVNYIKLQYPSWFKPVSKKKQHAHVQKLAKAIQKKEGIGDVQILKLDAQLYNRICSMSVDNALEHLQMFQEEPCPDSDPTRQEVAGVAKRSTSSLPRELPPAWRGPADAANEEKRVMVPAPLPEPKSTKANAAGVKLEKVDSLEHAGEPVQDPQNPKPEQGAAQWVKGLAPVIVKPEKVEPLEPSEEPVPNPQNPEPEQVVASKNPTPSPSPGLPQQPGLKQVAVKQEPVGNPADLQYPESTSTHTGEEAAVLISEKPIQTSDLKELKQVAASENSAPSPSPLEQPVLLPKEEPVLRPKGTGLKQATVTEDAVHIPGPSENPPLQTPDREELHQAPVCEMLYRQVPPRAPLPDPRRVVPNRVEIPVGESHFSKFMLSFVTQKPQPLIGLRVVVECRSFKQPTFYLCLTCAEKVNKNHICNHIISQRHQYCYIHSQYPDLVPGWEEDPTGVAWWVQHQEGVRDIQVMKMDLNLYNQVASAPFGMALERLLGTGREQSLLPPIVTAAHRPIIVNTPPPQKIPEALQKNPDNAGLPKSPTEDAVPHHKAAVCPEQSRTVLGPEQGQTVQTVPGPGLDPKHKQSDGLSPRYSVSMSEKRHQGPGLPQDPREAERQRADAAGGETANRGGAPGEPERPLQSSGQSGEQAPAAEAEVVVAPASPWEPWPNLKGTETDKVPVEKAFRPPLDLQAYMEDPNRTQPLVGLSALVECQSEKQVSFYLCVACRILLKTRVIEHVIGFKHRGSYLLKRRPDLFTEATVPQDSARKSSYLLDVAKEVEPDERGGVEEIQRVSFDLATYAKVKCLPFDKALCLVQTIYKEQKHSDLQTDVTPAQIPVMVKREKEESEECPIQSIQDLQIKGSDMSKVKSQSQDSPQEPVQHPNSKGTEGSPGGVSPAKTVTPPPQARQPGPGVKTTLIGLQLVIKCMSVDGCPPPFYLCQACSAKLTSDQAVIKHLTSSQHQYFYIKSRHPHRLEKEKAAGSLTCGMTDLVQFVAKKLEEEEGSGSLQVLKMPKELYERFKQRNYDYCMRMLKGSTGLEETHSIKPITGNAAQHTATRTPGPTLQHLGPRMDDSPESPSPVRLPVASDAHRPAEMKTNGSQQPNHVGSPPAPATLRPSVPIGCSVLERRSSQSQTRTLGPAHTPSHPASPSLAQPPAVKNTSHAPPSQTAAPPASEGGVRGQPISTVTRRHTPAVVRVLRVVPVGKRKAQGGDGPPWDYENRQFTSAPPPPKQGPGPRDPRLAPADGAPRPADTPTPRARQAQSSSSTRVSPPAKASRWDIRASAHGQAPKTTPRAADNATSGSPTEFAPPPVKIPGLDYDDSEQSPTERFIISWKAIVGGEGRL